MGKNQKVRHAFAGSWRQHRLDMFDGIYPTSEERGVTKRDRSGQRLSDVINPSTGFCTGVTSPMHNTDESSVRPAALTSGGGEPLPTRDETTGLWWVGNDRLVIRTTQTPDGPLHTPRIVKSEDLDEAGATPDERKAAVKAARTHSRKPDSPRRQAHKGTTGNRPSDKDVKAFLVLTTGYTGPITPAIRKAAHAVMAKEGTFGQHRAALAKAGTKAGKKR